MKFSLIALSLMLGTVSAIAAVPAELVLKKAAQDYGAECDGTDLEGRIAATERVETTVVKFEGQATTYHTVVCALAAYNSDSVVYYETGDAQLRQVHLTTVKLGARGKILGYYSTSNAGGVDIDAKGFLTTFYKGRGIGDAFEASKYRLENGQAVLVKYEVDSTFNGKIDPKVIVNIK